jgi:hypothetical protein
MAQQLTMVEEVGSQHLWQGQHPLSMTNWLENFFAHKGCEKGRPLGGA